MHRKVILNTSPLQYLHQLGLISILETLYSKIYVPFEVVDELDNGRAEGIDLPDLKDMGFVDILEIKPVHAIKLSRDLGKGETAVILHGLEHPECLIVLDDLLARRTAQGFGLKLTGTAGILIAAKEKGMIDAIRPHLDRLAEIGFFLSPAHKMLILRKAGEPLS